MSGYVEIAQVLELPVKDEQDQAVIVTGVNRWLMSTRRTWLLILDNADDLVVLSKFLPSKYGGHILLTMRTQAMGMLAQRLEVEAMDQKQGTLLLRRAALIAADGTLNDVSCGCRACEAKAFDLKTRISYLEMIF